MASSLDSVVREREQMMNTRQLDVESHPSIATERLVFRSGRLLAKPVPFEPITDPFSLICTIAHRPKFGHQYVLCPGRSRRPGGGVGLSVGPHWSGVIYTASIIVVITIFLTRFIMKDLTPWHQSATIACSIFTLAFLVATAVTDPGIVVESAEGGKGNAFCEVCSIWRPETAEHCEEWYVGMLYYCLVFLCVCGASDIGHTPM